ncbi:MAG: glycosyltransferase family 2 protein [Planctomycetes bacterium]|nr:glycosyltransferase family 2 protein [Planctomycetota bacterium]
MPRNHLLAIPVFNEEAYLTRVLTSARRYSRNILVVDDGSTDRTPHLLRRQDGVEIITHPENRGYGLSLADAFAFAIRRGFRWLITMDCDEQHDAAVIPRFVDVASEDDADIISGTRYPGGHEGTSGAPADRREINRRITAMLNDRLNLSLTDAFCGFKAYRVAGLERLSITVPGYAMPMQFWVQVARASLRVRELPVELIYNDPTRHFGGFLDDPAARLQHYVEVFEAELASPSRSASPDAGVTDRTGRTADEPCVPCARPSVRSSKPCSTSQK